MQGNGTEAVDRRERRSTRRTAARTAVVAAAAAASLVMVACEGSPTGSLAAQEGDILAAAAPASGAVVNTDVLNIPAVDPTNPGAADPLPDIRGTATAKCVNGGTQIGVHMKGLRPHGVYTIWIVQFDAPGFDGTFANLAGVGAIGGQTPSVPNDGYRNVLRASASGAGQLTKIHPAGALSIFGDSPSCLVDPEQLFELHVVGNYHADGETQGAFPAPPGPDTGWDEFAFIFVN